jgi:hypothetical protein
MRDTFADTIRAYLILGCAPRLALCEGLTAEIAFLRGLYTSGEAPPKSGQREYNALCFLVFLFSFPDYVRRALSGFA